MVKALPAPRPVVAPVAKGEPEWKIPDSVPPWIRRLYIPLPDREHELAAAAGLPVTVNSPVSPRGTIVRMAAFMMCCSLFLVGGIRLVG